MILVVGNCHIAGISAALQWLFPADNVQVIPFNPHIFKGDASSLTQRILDADIVMGGDFVLSFLNRNKATPKKFITIPSLYFSAFHPDIVTAKVQTSGTRIPVRYNSAIGLWAYSKGLSPATAASLFCAKNFKALGYLDCWDSSVARMKSSFETADLDFDRFFCAVKRDGIFMYTMNHPKVGLLIWMAKLLAIQLGHDDSVWRKEILISDALGRVEIWPVYPEIARELAVPGSYTWFADRGQVIEGLEQYLDFVFSKYAKSGLDPADISMMGVNQDLYDAVLSPALERI
jgi:hypothetical protein